MEPKCCERPSVYYANLIMHYRCAICGMMWHEKPEWAVKLLPWVGAIGSDHYGPVDADYDAEGHTMEASDA